MPEIAPGSRVSVVNPSLTFQVNAPRVRHGVWVKEGAPGPPGPSTDLTIGTVTQGGTAAATVNGESPNQTLDLTLPEGPQGDTGPQGPEGPQGVGVETGVVSMWATASPPSGYLLCDGTVYNVATYPDLGALLRSTWGGDGTTTFGVPDLRDAAPVGVSGTKTLASTGGADSVTLTEANLPAHTHDMGHDHGATSSDGSHDHQLSFSNATGGSGTNIPKGEVTNTLVSRNAVTADGSHTHTVSAHVGDTGSTGSGTAVSTQSPYVALQFIIKT